MIELTEVEDQETIELAVENMPRDSVAVDRSGQHYYRTKYHKLLVINLESGLIINEDSDRSTKRELVDLLPANQKVIVKFFNTPDELDKEKESQF